MQKAYKKLFSLLIKPQDRSARKAWGQSLVEVAIAFPVLIMLLTGVVEFGFILNHYLSLLDATRESARYWSNSDPFIWNPDPLEAPYGSDTFYYETARDVEKVLDPSTNNNPSYEGRRISLDPDIDDVIVSVYGADEDGVIDWRESDGGPYHLLPNPGDLTGNYPSIFTIDDIENTRVSDSPNAGILVVEVHYNYDHVLNLPWMTAWLPNPLHLQAYTIMPIRAAEPVETP